MPNKAFQCVFTSILTLVCLVVFISCSEPYPFGDVMLQLSVEGKAIDTGGRSVGPANDKIKIAYITVGGYSDKGSSIDDQTFPIEGSLKIKGLSAGNWHISVTGLNSEQLQITELTFDHNVKIESGKSTIATFNLQYRNKGSGSYEVTVTWPQEGGWFSQVDLSLSDAVKTSVTPEKTDTQAIFVQDKVSVGSYDVNLSFTNGSGTKIELPMMDTARIYNSLDSVGEIDLLDFDLMPVSDPLICVSEQRVMTLSSDTAGASYFYTIDGTDPLTSPTKQLYDTPVTVPGTATSLHAVGFLEGYRDSYVVSKTIESSDPEGGIVIEVPGTIDDLVVTRNAIATFSVAYTESGEGEKTIQWFMDGIEQTDTDNDDTFTYPATLTDGRHQVMVKITKSGITYASSLRFSAEDTGGIVIDVPGIIENLAISRTSQYTFAATYEETGDGEKTVQWFMDGIEQTDTDNDDAFTYSGILSAERHQVVVNIMKGEKTFSATLRFSLDDGNGSVVIDVPGTINDLTIKQHAGLSFTALYTETGSDQKQIQWFMDGVLQEGENDTMTYAQPLDSGRHQVMVKIIKDKKTYAATSRFTAYGVGDTGPAGGIIIQMNTDQSSSSWTYMEAAPSDLEGIYTWSEALRACSTATFNGFEDWILPSLSIMSDLIEYQSELNLKSSAWYWTSDDAAEGNKAWQIHSKTSVYEYYTKSAYNSVRAVRIF